MVRASVMIAVVLVAGYSIYAGLFVVGTVTVDPFPTDGGSVSTSEASTQGAGPKGSGNAEFDFTAVDAGVNYSYASKLRGFMATQSSAGVYVADYNGDGWEDLLAVGGESPVLFQNANGTFERSGALPTMNRNITTAVWIDHDVDGRPDLVVFAHGREPLLLENVGGGFEKRPSRFDQMLSVPTGATVADYDRDGCPDLFVYQNGDWNDRLPVGFENYSVSVTADNGEPNYLYRGTCGGFERVEGAGVDATTWTLAASFVDLNADGYPDIHVANDINHDIIYLNRGNGSFEQIVLFERTNRNGMSSEIADVTGNGLPDVFVTNIFYPEWAAEKINSVTKLKARGNNLVANNRGTSFVGRAQQYGIARGGWGWAAVIADFDNDADEDLFHTTRHMTFQRRDLVLDPQQIEKLQSHSFYSYPAVWKRSGYLSFRRVDTKDSGFVPANGRGAARLDYDRDGDADLVVATTDEYLVYENRMEQRNAVQIRVLSKNGSGTAAYGAKVFVTAGNQTRRVHAHTDYLSQDSRLVHVGIGNRTTVDVRVIWPDGTERTVEDVGANRRLIVTPEGVQHVIELG